MYIKLVHNTKSQYKNNLLYACIIIQIIIIINLKFMQLPSEALEKKLIEI